MKLLEQVDEACVTKHYTPQTEESYARWMERSHPCEIGHLRSEATASRKGTEIGPGARCSRKVKKQDATPLPDIAKL